MQNRVLPRKIRGVMFISPVSQERSERAIKASLLTASGMLLQNDDTPSAVGLIWESRVDMTCDMKNAI
jgi:hypothetical protein